MIYSAASALAALLYAVFFKLQGESKVEERLAIPGEEPAAELG